MTEIIVDTGPLVALLVKTDDHYAWMVDRLRELRPRFLTCAVLAEVAHLVRRYATASRASSVYCGATSSAWSSTS